MCKRLTGLRGEQDVRGLGMLGTLGMLSEHTMWNLWRLAALTHRRESGAREEQVRQNETQV